jgi:predicted AAA+ superfamily ATPase
VPWLADLVRTWDLYLAYGGFPVATAAARRGVPIPRAFVDDIFNVVFKDAFSDSASSETSMTGMFARLMEGMSNPVNLRSIAEDSGMQSHHTVARHINWLTNGYLAWSCPQKAETAWVSMPKAQAKVYATDPIVARFPHLRRPLRPDVDPTALHEMMLGVVLRRAAGAEGAEWEGDEFLFYHRTPARKEIDFVSDLFGGAAIEGKYIEGGAWRREAATVDGSTWRGILATRNVLDTDDADGAWAVPGGILGYLVDT